MENLFILLFLSSILCLIIGLITPKVFSRIMNGKTSRKKNFLVFGLSSVAFFVLFGMTSDAGTTQYNSKAGVVSEQNQNLPEEQAKKDIDYNVNYEENGTEMEQNGTEEESQDDDQENKAATIPREYKSALNKAATYANSMNMSKRGVYDQLVSEYGEKFSAEAAQYAIDNVTADWNANALAKAKTYQNNMDMSPSAIRDQLTSEYGEKFTQAEADYALEHLEK